MTRHHDHRLREIERKVSKTTMPPLTIVLTAETDGDEADFRRYAAAQPQGPLRVAVIRRHPERTP